MRSPIPSYRRQAGKCGDRAFVELEPGRRLYLGAWNSPESKQAYQRALAEWTAGGGALPVARDDISITELAARFWTFAQGYYRRADGSSTREVTNYKVLLRRLKTLYGDTPAAEFGPRRLKTFRERLIVEGFCRSYVNQTVNRVRRIFRWAVAEELLSPSVHQALAALPALRRGRSAARESEPVRAVAQEHVDAVRPFLSRQLVALVDLAALTGARMGELVLMRPSDLDMSAEVWTYRPRHHKTSYLDHERVVYLGPRAQEVIRPFLVERGLGDFLFSPAEAEQERRERAHAARATPMCCGNAPGRHRVRARRRPPGERYSVGAVGHAIRRACMRAGAPPWHPHQLRHLAATNFRRLYGIDVTETLLGHRSLQMADHYAERDAKKAAEVARRIG